MSSKNGFLVSGAGLIRLRLKADRLKEVSLNDLSWTLEEQNLEC
ncbi:MAG: hypothetical protein ABSC91_04270 [Candidatus Bathyarchaeia archaeon]|jgi:hypothetical protein